LSVEMGKRGNQKKGVARLGDRWDSGTEGV